MNEGRILNLTWKDLKGAIPKVDEPFDKMMVLSFLNFPGLPTAAEVNHKAYELADYCKRSHYHHALIDGPNFLMAPLEEWLKEMGVKVHYLQTVKT